MTEERAGIFLSLLEENHKVKKCTECECLQGGLVQLKIDYPELSGEIEILIAGKFHKCLGCKPCPPGQAWTKYSFSDAGR